MSDARKLADECWCDLIEKDDRTSPKDTPDMALITKKELASYIDRALHSQQPEVREVVQSTTAQAEAPVGHAISGLAAPASTTEPVAMLGGIHGVALIRHIETMLPEAQKIYHTSLYKQPPPFIVSDESWQRALDSAMATLQKPFYISRSVLDNAMQHAFGILSVGPSPAGDGAGPVAWREVEIVRLIDLLRSQEGDDVTILCDNPDFNDQPNCAVVCNGDWTEYKDHRFVGDTVLDALSAAATDYNLKKPRDVIAESNSHHWVERFNRASAGYIFTLDGEVKASCPVCNPEADTSSAPADGGAGTDSIEGGEK